MFCIVHRPFLKMMAANDTIDMPPVGGVAHPFAWEGIGCAALFILGIPSIKTMSLKQLTELSYLQSEFYLFDVKLRCCI